MHIPDGILRNEVCLAAGVCAAGAIGYSAWRLRQEKEPRPLVVAGAVAAIIFAGQMMNFSIPGLPVSGHLIGATLAAAWLGPWAGCLAMAAVLAVQAIVFADGGLAALGANILNMAVIGAWGTSAILSSLKPAGIGRLPAVGIASWGTVILAATAFCVEFVASWRLGIDEIGTLVVLMLGTHAVIGIGEAVITVVGLALLGLMASGALPRGAVADHGARRFAVLGLVAACLIAGVCSPWASPYPDGLESVGERMAFHDRGIVRVLILSDYAVPLPEAWEAFSLPLAGLLGTLLCYQAAMAIGTLCRWLPLESGRRQRA